jgi:hypothetical protein
MGGGQGSVRRAVEHSTTQADNHKHAVVYSKSERDGLILATRHIDLYLPKFHHDFINCVVMVGCHTPDCSSCTSFES